jgi:hypothetical protein
VGHFQVAISKVTLRQDSQRAVNAEVVYAPTGGRDGVLARLTNIRRVHVARRDC